MRLETKKSFVRTVIQYLPLKAQIIVSSRISANVSDVRASGL